MNSPNGADPSIVDIVNMRTWKHALFTTYTLSLSYFESEIVRSLLRGGCSDIWLIADAEGYRSSLLERRSMLVGQEYRLVPIALPDGVFHAKCIYLAGDQGDLLLVGSGNVTFGGHGRNAEVFEALSPTAAASAYRDFADFLEAIGSRPDITLARSEWVDNFAARARLAADRGADQDGLPPLRLVHPVNESVIDQLAALLVPYGACKEAVVMSPYHDLDGLAVRKLAERLSIPKSSVAVTEEGVSPFPFEQTNAWPLPVSPVMASRTDKRFVHAKWYEFQTESHRLLLTGSINATRKALTTTDNVELGVLRCLAAESAPLVWKPVNCPAFKPQQRLPSGLKAGQIVYACFDRQDVLLITGRIISFQSPEGVWKGRLIQADGDAAGFEVDVRADGSFVVRSSVIEAFSEMPAVQLLMVRGDREARGWVHNEMFLSVSGMRRLTGGSLSRLMRGDGTNDDIEALLDYLSVQAEQHLRIFDRPLQKAEDGGDLHGVSKPLIVTLADLLPGGESAHTTALPSKGSSSTPGQFDLTMSRLRRMLLGHGRAKTSTLHHSAHPEAAEGDDSVSSGTKHSLLEERTLKMGLANFEQEIARLIKQAQGRPSVVRGLLSMELEIVMSIRIHHLGDLDGAHEFLQSWFSKACQIAHSEPEQLTSLQQHIVTAAAILLLLAARTGDVGQLAVDLHDNLERYFGGTVHKNKAIASLIPDIHVGFAALLAGVSDQATLTNALLAIFAQPTTRQQHVDALALASQGKAIPKEWKVFKAPLGAELHEALSLPNWSMKVRAGINNMTACAFDYYSFSRSDAADYRRLRVARCIHCGRFTVNLQP